MAIGIRLLARPPDPTWRGARCWPEGATLYLASQVTAETGTPPVSVCQAVARGLCALGPVAFLGYALAHEGHHRGQILLHLKIAKLPLDRATGYSLWYWNKI